MQPEETSDNKNELIEKSLGEFKNYLVKSSSLFLDFNNEQSVLQILNQEQNLKTMESFLTDSKTHHLYFLIEQNSDDVSLRNSLKEINSSKGIAYIKKGDLKVEEVVAKKAFRKAFHIINLGNVTRDFNPIEVARNCVKNAFAPMLKDLVNQGSEAQSEKSRPISKHAKDENFLKEIQNKIDDIEIQYLKNNASNEVPQVKLIFDEEIIQLVEQNPRAQPEDMKESLANDPVFQNRLKDSVIKWGQLASILIHHSSEIVFDSLAGEKQFWENYKISLLELEKQLKSPETNLTINILKAKKKFNKKNDIVEELNLRKKVEDVQTICDIMAEMNIDLLEQSKDIDELSTSIVEIFTPIKKLFQNIVYPEDKLMKLLENFSSRITDKLIQIFEDEKIMEIDFQKFSDLQQELKKKIVFAWNNQIAQIKDNINQNSNVDNTQLLAFVYKMKHSRFNDRIRALHQFRESNESLVQILRDIYGKEDGLLEKLKTMNFVNEEDIDNTFKKFIKKAPLFDLSPQGQTKLEEAKEEYNAEIDQVEKDIIMKIRDLLGATKNQQEMFNVFTKFSGLMRRNQIKNAIREYQDQLIQRIQDKTNGLFQKYKKTFQNSGAVEIAKYYGMLDVSGAYIWGQQISNHIKKNVDDIELVLGDSLKNTEQGKEIKKFHENFLRMRQREVEEGQLDQNELQIEGKLLKLENVNRNNMLKLQVNFTPENEKKITELRNIIKKKDYFKSSLSKKFYFKKTAWPVYVNALRLMESVRIWNYIVPKLDKKITNLLAHQLKGVYVEIERGFKYEWSNRDQGESDLQKYFFQFYEQVQDLEIATEYIYEKITLIDDLLKELGSCESKFDTFEKHIEKIQEIIDELLLKKFTNIGFLVKETNEKIEKIFIKRLSEVLTQWTEDFIKYIPSKKKKNQDKMIKDHLKHEILVRNKNIFIEPPIQEARTYWLDQLHGEIHIYTAQKQLVVNRYQLTFDNEKKDKINLTFSSIIGKISATQLSSAYKAINNIINKAEGYVKTWLSYQALWDIDINIFYEKFGEDLNTWQKVLADIKSGRTTFDNTSFEKNFGPVVINYKNVQLKINNLYDNLHKNIIAEFANKFMNQQQSTQKEMEEVQDKLEKMDLSDPTKLIDAINTINHCKKNVNKWEDTLSKSKDNEKLLVQQKFHFPDDYKNAEQQEKDFKRFKQVYTFKQKHFENNIENVKNSLAKEEEVLMVKLDEIKELWNNKKPFAADLKPDEALGVLDTLEETIKKNREKLEQLNVAKKLLNLPEIELEIIYQVVEDSSMLRQMWEKVKQIWSPCEELMKTTFEALQPVKFAKAMDSILSQISDLPAEQKNHEIFQGKKQEVSNLKKQFKIIRDMKSEAIKEHHFHELLRICGITKNPQDILLGDLFKCNVLAYEKQINEVISNATGELVLELMINKIKDFWHEEIFQTSNYQGKIQLIKGWDNIVERAEEDLGTIGTMKFSSHFKTFEGEISGWNERILKISQTLGVWMDVQRKWVYLEGIFLGSSDIKENLSGEYERFMKVDHEFKNIMKQMVQKQKVLDTIQQIPNLLKTLEFLSETLDKIQKSLSDYLEKQRQAFSRFYFVGDEDLLEIIGNMKQIPNIQKYFSKMFAGINSVMTEQENQVLVGMKPKQKDEKVVFLEQIALADYDKIDKWLKKLEEQMQESLGSEVEACIMEWKKIQTKDLRTLVDKFPTQIIILAFQTFWTWKMEENILQGVSTKEIEERTMDLLAFMAEEVLTKLENITRIRYQQLITELVHKRDVSRLTSEIAGLKVKDFKWQYYMRYNLSATEKLLRNKLKVNVGNSEFVYSYEYLGITEKLVQTPLTDKCYFTLTQALWLRMGGAPFGPAGTGKTESVKMLGNSLGRFVLVFNCDENFNFKAMGRIFIGLCQVGAWGCFDEFNRLEERILSAVSQQILAIQTGLREDIERIDLMDRNVLLNVNMGIFVTMNPGYAGRSNLPENLKQLFRQMAMIKPDSVLIAQVMLFSQGFKSAEQLSGKVVALFELCNDQLSSQPHYDFGLRALKSVLNSAGNLKRSTMQDGIIQNPHSLEEEQKIILRSFCDTVVPKLISEDGPLLKSLIQGVFPQVDIPPIDDKILLQKIEEQCHKRFLRFSNEKFKEKVLQLSQILKLHHGVMLVGPTGVAKSAAWKTLLSCLTQVDDIKGERYIIDPKAIKKDDLYGVLDNTTMEWTDGIFTYILRKIIENQRGESSKRHWIVFDGDVDPEWAENLNSVLDDNKLLTLPNGERLAIPSNVKILFEVESLKYATLATVSRCGMVWFSEDILEDADIYHHYLERLKQENYDALSLQQDQENDASKLREALVENIRPLFENTNGKGFVSTALHLAYEEPHVMVFTRIRALEALFALVRRGISKIIEKDQSTFGNYGTQKSVLSKFMINWTASAVQWAFVGDLKLFERSDYFKKLQSALISLPDGLSWPAIEEYITLIDYEIRMDDGEFALWKNRVPVLDIQPEQVTKASLIITTVDTMRHQEVLCGWLLEHRPFIICGPPGSGKTMTLMSTLQNLQDFDMIFVNFSSSTDPQLILKQFERYCEYVKGASSVSLRPRSPNKWLVVFCDEINLPDEDNYGTQFVITFLRQLTEQHGFWRPSDKQWVKLERIQFVGACNPPTDAGRHPLANRFLRHCPLILVDFPGYESLTQIYGTFNRGMLKRTPQLKQYADSLTKAMVEYYSQSQKRFTSDQQPHYIYSPRELTRWKYAINEALDTVESLDDLVRLWAHEALRLFEDRLVNEEEKKWCQEKVDEMGNSFFPGISSKALERPIIFSTYLTKSYQSVKRDDLRMYVMEQLKRFNEEEYDVQLVVFDEVLEHIIKIDRVLKQPIGHMLLVGASGVGKTTLSRFVSWINGLKVFQIKAGRNYSLANFDDDLRHVMKRAGCKREQITFIFDESNVLSVAFLERMNALLASGEVPGLFEGEEFGSLINNYKESQDGKVTETDDEIYQIFTNNVQRNLHVVFTMNPANPDFSNRTASSPAIFNRCVIDWFGDWPVTALYKVAGELTQQYCPKEQDHSVFVDLIVKIHESIIILNDKLRANTQQFNFVTPRDFIDFIRQFIKLWTEKQHNLNETQSHLNEGLKSLKETEDSVLILKKDLAKFNEDLEIKNQQAEEKLNLIIQKKNEANEKIQISKKISEEAQVKQDIIQTEAKKVQDKLDGAQPALIKAKEEISKIKPSDIRELTNYQNPPPAVKISMCTVVALIQKKVAMPDWETTRKACKEQNFLDTVKNFDLDKEKVKQKTIDLIIQQFWGNEKDEDARNEHLKKTLADIEKASKAAIGLANYLVAQISYRDILTMVDPLREKIASMNAENQVLVDKINELQITIKELEVNIVNYQKEYEQLIQQTEELKVQKETVSKKINKAESLLTGLSSEKIRWSQSSKDFGSQFKTLLGDVLISAAFLTYIGFFGQFYRELLISTWKQYLVKSKIDFRKDISLVEFLSVPSERILWQRKGLPSDVLATQNAIILKRYNRYPLIIDPSGQAFDFMINLFDEGNREKQLIRTSFIDVGFMKQLETALRFGLPILIQDVEKIEPILNSVLNKEITKQGGRVLIRVGDQEIDFKEEFKLFMITRNSNAKFTPDLCSRVTFVNFTVTKSSLENQFKNIYLKNERPDVEQKRINLLKLQGEFIVKLRQLEDDLLNEISSSQGQNILENDEMIQKLETIKKESTHIEEEMSKSDVILKEIEEVISQYVLLANISSKLYFLLQKTQNINMMYQYSLKFYMNIVMKILTENENLKAVSKDDSERRIKVIEDELFKKVYAKVVNSLMEKDKLLFALMFAQVRLEKIYGNELADLFRASFLPSKIIETTLPSNILGELAPSTLIRIEDLSQRKGFSGLLDSLRQDKQKWLKLKDDPTYIDLDFWDFVELDQMGLDLSNQQLKDVAKMVVELIIFNIFKPTKAIIKYRQFVDFLLSKEFFESNYFNLKVTVEEDADQNSAVLFSSAPGFDPSSKIYDLAKQLNKSYEDVAIGSAEGFELAYKSIDSAAKNGSWVILKNVHLAPSWLKELEQDLFRMKPNPNFRLFLLTEFSDKIPQTLLRSSIKFIFELPDGVKSSVKRTYDTVFTPERSDRFPPERCRLHFLLSWMHAVIMERLRYTPTGWSKKYEFSEADQKCAMDIIDEYIDLQEARQNLQLENIPFEALRSIITNNIYGGKIDNAFDLKILKSIIDTYLTEDAFDPKNTLVEDKNGSVKHPDAIKHHDYKNWITNLKQLESPIWAGLPSSADDLLVIQKLEDLQSSLAKVQDMDSESITSIQKTEKADGDSKGKHLMEISDRTRLYLDILPGNMEKLERNEELISNPLFRFLEREITASANLLSLVRKQLQSVKDMCDGTALPLQDTKLLAEQILQNVVPKFWKKYVIPTNLGFSDWIKDFKNRITQLQPLANLKDWQRKGVNLGEFLFPEAFITATRQFVATKNKLSMDELEMKISFTDEKQVDEDSFLVNNLWIEGVKWSKNGFELTDDMVHHLKGLKFTWSKCKPIEAKTLEHDEIFVPLYLNSQRQNLICPIKFKYDSKKTTDTQLYQRGIALIAWKM